jgi:hypothetical protein
MSQPYLHNPAIRSGQGLGFAAGEDFLDWYGGYSDWDYWYDSYFGGGGGGGDWYTGYSDWDYWYDAYFGSDGGSSGGSDYDLWLDFVNSYLAEGWDIETAIAWANEDMGADRIGITTTEKYLPNVPQPEVDLPWWYTPNFDWMPTFDFGDEVIPPPPGSGQRLPKACYGPTYHPYPIGHPQQDLCVPYPNDPNARRRIQQQQQQQQQQQRRAQQQQQQQPCKPKPGEWFNPKTRKCEPIPKCTTPGTVFDPRAGRCVPPNQLSKPGSGFPWWILLVLAGAYVISQSGDNDRPTYRRRAK